MRKADGYTWPSSMAEVNEALVADKNPLMFIVRAAHGYLWAVCNATTQSYTFRIIRKPGSIGSPKSLHDMTFDQWIEDARRHKPKVPSRF